VHHLLPAGLVLYNARQLTKYIYLYQYQDTVTAGKAGKIADIGHIKDYQAVNFVS